MSNYKNEQTKAKTASKNYLIFESNKTNYIDLDNMGVEDKITIGHISVDVQKAEKAVLSVSFNCNLEYNLSLTEQLNLLFKLYRRDKYGNLLELTNKPYSVSLFGDLDSEEASVSLQKNESFHMDYLDEINIGDLYTYTIEVSLIYSSADEASIQNGNITAIGKATKGLC